MSNARITVDIMYAGEAAASKNRHYFVIQEEEGYRRFADDVSSLAVLYVTAHDYSLKHADAKIIIHCRVDSAEQYQHLQQALLMHGDLLPNELSVSLCHKDLLAHNDEAVNLIGSGSIDQDAHANAEHMMSLARLKKLTINTAENVDFKEFIAWRSMKSGERALAVMLDADGCIYNYNYTMMLLMLIFKYSDQIKQLAKSDRQHHPEKKTFADKLMAEIKLVNLADFTDDLCNMWLDHLTLHGRIDDADIRADSLKYRDDHYKPVVRQYMRYLSNIHPDIMMCIIYQANQGLFERIVNQATSEQCAGVVLMVGSNRQSAEEDMNNSKWNATGLFFHDLHELTRYLNRIYHHKISFSLDRFLMADAYNNLHPGESYRRALQQHHAHPYSVFDKSKVSIVFAFMHHIKRNYPGVYLVKFFDDLKEIPRLLKNIIEDCGHRAVLPKDLPLKLIMYNGEFVRQGVDKADVELMGSGELDHDIYDSVMTMARLSGANLENIHCCAVSHNIAVRLDFEVFAARFLPKVNETPVRLNLEVLERCRLLFFSGIVAAHLELDNSPSKRLT